MSLPRVSNQEPGRRSRAPLRRHKLPLVTSQVGVSPPTSTLGGERPTGRCGPLGSLLVQREPCDGSLIVIAPRGGLLWDVTLYRTRPLSCRRCSLAFEELKDSEN